MHASPPAHCCPGPDASTAVDAVVSAIADALERGETVNIAGFGKFTTTHRAARPGRNPRTDAAVAVPARTVPTFKVAVLFATGSPTRMASSGVRSTPFVPVSMSGRVRTPSNDAPRCAGVELRTLPPRLRGVRPIGPNDLAELIARDLPDNYPHHDTLSKTDPEWDRT